MVRIQTQCLPIERLFLDRSATTRQYTGVVNAESRHVARRSLMLTDFSLYGCMRQTNGYFILTNRVHNCALRARYIETVNLKTLESKQLGSLRSGGMCNEIRLVSAGGPATPTGDNDCRSVIGSGRRRCAVAPPPSRRSSFGCVFRVRLCLCSARPRRVNAPDPLLSHFTDALWNKQAVRSSTDLRYFVRAVRADGFVGLVNIRAVRRCALRQPFKPTAVNVATVIDFRKEVCAPAMTPATSEDLCATRRLRPGAPGHLRRSVRRAAELTIPQGYPGAYIFCLVVNRKLPNVASAKSRLRIEFLDPLLMATKSLERLGLPIGEWPYLLFHIVKAKLFTELKTRF
ncbi:hypothetical protein EVAR_94835_1 [Eumeta japonica]|uniref:Uncharacterized protein n=1 Tax=Eumeta variegata TaxID=151549 RepID=A0A4C1UHD1_EUMVA|nr:hypothetical protein EVAR_94835_1 [Eumeta japonica]